MTSHWRAPSPTRPAHARAGGVTPLAIGDSARRFVVTGAIAIVVGGLVAAANASVPTEKGSWLAAYLVLVVGVTQVGLGAGQEMLADPAPTVGRLTFEYVAFNAGSLGVLVGTLLGPPLLVDLGGIALVAALVTFMASVPRHWTPWPLVAYRLLVIIVVASVPIGLVLARVG